MPVVAQDGQQGCLAHRASVQVEGHQVLQRGQGLHGKSVFVAHDTIFFYLKIRRLEKVAVGQ